MKTVEQNIAKHKDEWIAYVYKSPNQKDGGEKQAPADEGDIEKDTENNNKEGGSANSANSEKNAAITIKQSK